MACIERVEFIEERNRSAAAAAAERDREREREERKGQQARERETRRDREKDDSLFLHRSSFHPGPDPVALHRCCSSFHLDLPAACLPACNLLASGCSADWLRILRN